MSEKHETVTERWFNYDTGFQTGKIHVSRGQVKTDKVDEKTGQPIYETDFDKKGTVRLFTQNVNNGVKQDKNKQFNVQLSVSVVMDIVKAYNEGNGFKEMLDDLYAKDKISELYSMKNNGLSPNTILAAARDYGIAKEVAEKIIGG
ncbi:hypothetical protein MmarC5_1283 [Methanococcus maripaludis C5]|uniref:Uncharacterized protein n=1 Tax=Methanococcus maripaludis (strain C5 / ATCC BAA-1333) TaxID=402880 RepID=A4FZE7_METM5|nr:hypothetical protein [Methanococcus maripaludis]ABO35581.1 hypothetical protein MmarC5_1283 [Methanococcus maripaludis C5]